MSGVKRVLERLDSLNIEYELYTHQPIEKVSDRDKLGLTYGGADVCKNLLLTTRNKSVFILLMLLAKKEADLKAISRKLKTSRLCFAGEHDIARILGQKPGCVGVTGVINDKENIIKTVLFDSELRGTKRVAMHPGDNKMTVLMPFEDIERYVKSCNAQIEYIEI